MAGIGSRYLGRRASDREDRREREAENAALAANKKVWEGVRDEKLAQLKAEHAAKGSPVLAKGPIVGGGHRKHGDSSPHPSPAEDAKFS